MTTIKYAGIGSRNTPKTVITVMEWIAMSLGINGYTLCTGAAKGADQAFSNGALIVGSPIKMCLPWPSYEMEFVNKSKKHSPVEIYIQRGNTHFDVVKKFHPAWDRLKNSVIKLHARNAEIVKDCKFIICWTPGGKVTGGTGMAMRIANNKGIPIYNLAVKRDYTDLLDNVL